MTADGGIWDLPPKSFALIVVVASLASSLIWSEPFASPWGLTKALSTAAFLGGIAYVLQRRRLAARSR